MMKRISIVLLFAFLLGCASPKVAYKKDFDFSRIHVFKVGEFTSAPQQPNSGSSVANEFIRQLLTLGFTVKTTESENTDVVLMGNVTEYLPNYRYLIQSLEDNKANQVIVLSQPVPLSGTSVYNLGSTYGLGDGNKIIVSNATVGISAYLKDVNTGEIVWSSTYSYEGLDLRAAIEGAVRYLLRSLPI